LIKTEKDPFKMNKLLTHYYTWYYELLEYIYYASSDNFASGRIYTWSVLNDITDFIPTLSDDGHLLVLSCINHKNKAFESLMANNIYTYEHISSVLVMSSYVGNYKSFLLVLKYLKRSINDLTDIENTLITCFSYAFFNNNVDICNKILSEGMITRISAFLFWPCIRTSELFDMFMSYEIYTFISYFDYLLLVHVNIESVKKVIPKINNFETNGLYTLLNLICTESSDSVELLKYLDQQFEIEYWHTNWLELLALYHTTSSKEDLVLLNKAIFFIDKTVDDPERLIKCLYNYYDIHTDTIDILIQKRISKELLLHCAINANNVECISYLSNMYTVICDEPNLLCPP
jgi:hypothetical protein